MAEIAAIMPVIRTSSVPGLSCMSMKFDPHHSRIKREFNRVVRMTKMLCLMRGHPEMYSPVNRSMSTRCSVAGCAIGPLRHSYPQSLGSRSSGCLFRHRHGRGRGLDGRDRSEDVRKILAFGVRHGDGRVNGPLQSLPPELAADGIFRHSLNPCC